MTINTTHRRLAVAAAACLLLGVGGAGLDVRPVLADAGCCGNGGGKSSGKTDAERALENAIKQDRARGARDQVYSPSGTNNLQGHSLSLPLTGLGGSGNVTRQRDAEAESSQINRLGDLNRRIQEQEEAEAEARREVIQEWIRVRPPGAPLHPIDRDYYEQPTYNRPLSPAAPPSNRPSDRIDPGLPGHLRGSGSAM